MKLGMYWTYPTRSLVRGGQRTLLAIICISVGVLAIVAMQQVTYEAQAGLTGDARQVNGGDLNIDLSAAPLTANDLAFFTQIETQGAITHYTAVDAQPLDLRYHGAALSVKLLAIDPTAYPLPGGITFDQPRDAQLSHILHDGKVVITSDIATALQLHLGDTFTFGALDGRTSEVTIGGIMQTSGLYQYKQILIDHAHYAALPSATYETVIDNIVYVDVPGHTDANATAVERRVHAQFPLAETQTIQELLAVDQNTIQTIRTFLQSVGLLALLIGGMGIFNTIQVSLSRRRMEIATLKTVGFRSSELALLFGVETGLIGLIGGIVGTGAGLGISLVLKSQFERIFAFTFPTIIDGASLLSGLAIGSCAAVIFGLMPIVHASQMRPKTVLRDRVEGIEQGSMFQTIGLTFLLIALFSVLALSIVQQVQIALLIVAGVGIVLGLLSLIVGILVFAISHLPVSTNWNWKITGSAGGLETLGVVLLLVRQPAGWIVVVLASLVLLLIFLPRTEKARVAFALRNLGQTPVRTVITILALCVSTFTIGMVLVTGLSVRASLEGYIVTSPDNIAVIAHRSDQTAIVQQLAMAPGVKNMRQNIISKNRVVAINGQPISTLVGPDAIPPSALSRSLSGIQGYSLATGDLPDSRLYTLVRGGQDNHIGRNLTTSDTGTGNALVPQRVSLDPLDLHLGDTITLSGQTSGKQATITIVGFYTSTFAIEPVQVDAQVVQAISSGTPLTLTIAYVTPSAMNTVLAAIQGSVPSAQTTSLADSSGYIEAVITNIITFVATIASLALFASIINIANSVTLSMFERWREIGILKGLGYTSRHVLSITLLENGVAGLIGSLLAVTLMIVMLPLFGQVFHLTFALPFWLIAGTIVAIAALCIVVAALVAWRAVHVRPLEVLRFE
jgi:putative ABC transport system permease protein